MSRALWILVGVLALLRLVYHLVYVLDDPFARVALSDGQVYEEAARDILAHPPLGTQPFYLQGSYAYLLAIGMALRAQLVDALLLQLVIAGITLCVFARTVSVRFGARAGAFSTALLLSCASLAFYENKFLSASFGVTCNVLVLTAFMALEARATRRAALLLGVTSGLALLARPNMLFALPFSALAVVLVARSHALRSAPLVVAFALGCVLAVAPMAARNVIVTGKPSVFASHGGGTPFYIGNGPQANGLWNDAGGLLSGQVLREQAELAPKLGIRAEGAALHEAVGKALYARAFAFMRDEPGKWLALEAKKLWYTLGNDELAHDYDWLGERELLGPVSPVGLPFGVLLGLGTFGLFWLCWRSREQTPCELGTRDERFDRAWVVVLLGQLVAVLLANVVWFTAAQHRMPLVVPLAFAAGPLLDDLLVERRHVLARRLPLMAAGLCALLAAQAFLPRGAPKRPSSAHYYNLGNASELLARYPQALLHYRQAIERNPKKPMYFLRLARLAVAMHRDAEASTAIDMLLAMPDLPTELRAAALSQRRVLDARAR